MSVHPKGAFYQLNDDGTPNEKSKIHYSQRFTDKSLTEQQLIVYATYEIRRHYNLYEKFKIKAFSLRKPFYIDASLGKNKFNFICQPLSVSQLKKLKPEDLPFHLKKTLFVVLPVSREILKEKQPTKELTPTDLSRLLNAIDNKAQQHFKQFSPILYTGMTN